MNWTVYLVLDEDGDVIYVGMSGSFASRRSAHLRNFPEAREVRAVYRFDDKWEALNVESVLIQAHRPAHNCHGNPQRGVAETKDEKLARLTAALVEARVMSYRFAQRDAA
jgi:excinuclease UvrABC nuclease subunit